MKKTRTKYHLFSEMKVLDEIQDVAINEPTQESKKLYCKMQNLFFKHCKEESKRK